MSSPTEFSHYGDLTVDQARSMRVEQAKLTALYAQRAKEAHAASRRGAVAHWRHEYRQSARKCRLLGERIRAERSQSPATGGPSGPNVVRLNPRAPAPWPQTGRVA
jgi:hypothetical protein